MLDDSVHASRFVRFRGSDRLIFPEYSSILRCWYAWSYPSHASGLFKERRSPDVLRATGRSLIIDTLIKATMVAAVKFTIGLMLKFWKSRLIALSTYLDRQCDGCKEYRNSYR